MNNFNFIYSEAPKEVSFPNPKNENWRYINLNSLKEKISGGTQIDKPQVVSEDQNIDSHILIKDNSILLKQDLPEGINFEIIESEKINTLNNKLKNKIGKVAKIDDYFVSENTKNFNQLIIINITKKADPEVTLNLDFEVSSNIDLKPRFLVYLEKDTSSSIQIMNQNNEAIINSVFEFYLADQSNLNLVGVNNSNKSVEILNYWFEINKGANLNVTFISLGDKQTLKNDIRIDLVGKGAQADIGGLYMPKPDSVVDYNLKMNHCAKKTFSNQFFRGILEEKSQASFTGLVKIEKGCSDSKSQQANNNLLLSEKAQIKSDPQLEIYCNDVECAHGSTIGQFDEDALFYLCSRGISKRYGKRMLLEAFYMDILNRMDSPTIQSMVEESIV